MAGPKCLGRAANKSGLFACQTWLHVDVVPLAQLLLSIGEVIARQGEGIDSLHELNLKDDETLIAEGSF